VHVTEKCLKTQSVWGLLILGSIFFPMREPARNKGSDSRRVQETSNAKGS
jgi:hypothetical protein